MASGPVVTSEQIEQENSVTQAEEPYLSLSNFSIQKQIGRGQFSTVYRAVCNVNDNHVALKKISLLAIKDAKSSQDCLKEASLLQKLKHPNIIKCLASFIEDFDLVMVLELADAGDVAKMIQDFAKAGYLIPERTIWHYFVQIACAIEYMHSQKIMHRDIKPANVFITADKVIKLGDFGFGRFFSPETLIAHSLLGTPYYMSPERVKEAGYDFKSDIWSLGCLLYEMAALQSPFFSRLTNLCFIYKRIENADYPPIPSDVYSAELRHMVKICLEKDAKVRPESKYVHGFAREMCCKLENS